MPKVNKFEVAGIDGNPTASVPDKLPWPKSLSAQVAASRALLPAIGPDPSTIASHFGKRTKARLTQITEILETLRGLGKI